MAKRFFDSRKFQDPWYRGLAPEYKCFWEYLICSCDHAGVWKVDLDLAGFCIGAKIDKEKAKEVLDGRIVEIEDGKWFIPKFIAFQYGVELFKGCPTHQEAITILETLKNQGVRDGFVIRNQRVMKGLRKGCQTLPKAKAKAKAVTVTATKEKGVIGEKDFIATIKQNPAYKHIDIDRELFKMDAWLALPKNKGRKKTPRFVLAWINKVEAPILAKPRYIPPNPKPNGPLPTDAEVKENLRRARELVNAASPKGNK